MSSGELALADEGAAALKISISTATPENGLVTSVLHVGGIYRGSEHLVVEEALRRRQFCPQPSPWFGAPGQPVQSVRFSSAFQRPEAKSLQFRAVSLRAG